MNRRTKIAAAVLAVGATAVLAGCTSDADQVSYNLSQEAEQFNIERQIVFYNGITGEYLLEINGRCSVEPVEGRLEVICKVGPDQFTKDFLGLSDNVTYFAHQTKVADVDEYTYKVILKPETIIPDFDLETSGGDE